MQQTEKYKLNLIEMTDTFSPAPLNENAQKLEAALQAAGAALDAEAIARNQADAALSAQLDTFEVRRIAIGTYKPVAHAVIEVGFRPKVVIMHAMEVTATGGMMIDADTKTQDKIGVIVDNGFQIGNVDHVSIHSTQFTYAFVALA